MRRFVVLVSLLAVSFGGAAAAPVSNVHAQDATPMPDPRFIGLPEGVSAWEVGDFTQIPSTYRLEFAPGAVLSQDAATNLVIALVYVETGVLTLTVETPMAINRADATDAPEIVEAGVEFTVEAGDYFVLPPNVASETRNDGDEAATAQYAMMDPLHPIIVDPNQERG